MDLGNENNVFSMLGGSIDGYVSLGYFKGYDPLIDPCCVCLGYLASKVMWTAFFNPSYYFSKAFDKVKRILIVFGVILLLPTLCFLNCGPRSLIVSYVRRRHLMWWAESWSCDKVLDTLFAQRTRRLSLVASRPNPVRLFSFVSFASSCFSYFE